MPKTSERRPAPVALSVSSPSELPEQQPVLARVPYLPWLVAAIVGSVGVVLLGWVAVALPVSVSWLTATWVPLPNAVDVVNHGWLALHGVRVELGDVTVGIAPLGLTLLVAAAVAVTAHYAAGQMDAPAGESLRHAMGRLGRLVAATTASYTVAALIFATLIGGPGQALRAGLGAAALALVSSLFGGARGVLPGRLGGIPGWVRSGTRGALVAVGLLALASVVTAAVALIVHYGRVKALAAGLDTDGLNGVGLWLLQASYTPNLLLWAGSYALGGGFTLGVGTVVSPGAVVLGLVPAIPAFGAFPTQAVAFPWAFHLIPVAVGGLSGWVTCRALRRREGVLSWAWWPATAAGGALVATLVWLAASALSRGDLGTVRLVGLGPKMVDLALLTVTPVVLSAAVVGAVYWLTALRPLREDEPVTPTETEPAPDAESPTP